MGEESRYSHVTAAHLHGVDTGSLDDRVWITIPHRRFVRPRPGLIVSRTRHFPEQPSWVRGQQVMPLARTLVDLAQILDKGELRKIMYDVVGRGRVEPEEVLAAAEGFGGRVGIALIREVVRDFEDAYETAVEREADQHFRSAGIFLTPQFEVWEHGVLLARVDLADEEVKVGVEIDGERHHTGPWPSSVTSDAIACWLAEAGTW